MGDNNRCDLESNVSENAGDDWSTFVVNQSSIMNNVFPPNNHEGLGIHSETFSQALHQTHDQLTSSTSKPQNSRLNVAVWWDLVFNFMRSNVSCIRSWLWKYEYRVSGVISFLFSPATSLLLVLLYMKFQKRQRGQAAALQLQDDCLIKMVRERDEEINKLMGQIAQMKKLLDGVEISRPRAT